MPATDVLFNDSGRLTSSADVEADALSATDDKDETGVSTGSAMLAWSSRRGEGELLNDDFRGDPRGGECFRGAETGYE